ncbi:MAG: glutamine amidotransferase [Coxiellaceae bacterium]|nr:glutamine amidotransferase [Coxiellaceae bacterium]
MKVFLYVLDTLADWEIGYITAELNSRRFLKKMNSPIALTKIGNSIKPIKTMGGIIITPDESVHDVVFSDDDVLILPGADSWLDNNNIKIMSLIPELLDRNVTVAAICGATLALAKNGILDNRKHTSNEKSFLKMSCPKYSGEALYLNEPVVSDGCLITATGLAPLEFSYELFKKIDVMNPETLEAWYKLNKTKDSKYFFMLMDSLK